AGGAGLRYEEQPSMCGFKAGPATHGTLMLQSDRVAGGRLGERNIPLLLVFPHESERACHPERSARNARVAKDLLSFLVSNSRSFAPAALRMTCRGAGWKSEVGCRAAHVARMNRSS